MKVLAFAIPAVVALAARGAAAKQAEIKDHCIKDGQLAITFDDGPAPERTPKLLKTLAEYEILATLFLNVKNVGNIIDPHSADAHIVRKAHDAGHVIASHTFSHEDLAALAEKGRKNDVRNQLCWADRAIAKIIGKAPRLFRAPYGSLNKSVRKMLQKYGYVVVHWNIDTNDYKKDSTVDGVVRAYTDNLNRVKSAIALQHDIFERTVEKFVPAIIDAVNKHKKRWTYVTADVCVGADPYRPDPWQGTDPSDDWYCPPMPRA